MSDIKYDHYLKNLDKLESYLDKPDIPSIKNKKIKPLNCFSRFFDHIWNRIRRLANYIFGDHHWYSEDRAQKVVNFYITKIPPHQQTPNQKIKIIQIFNHLAHLKKGKGTYADGLDQEALKKFLAKTPDKISGNDLLNVIEVSDEPNIANESDLNYEFLHLKGLPGNSKKMLFHIHANQFGKNSSLEGYTAAETLGYLHTYLTARKTQNTKDKDCFDDILSELKEAIVINNTTNPSAFVQKAQQKIKEAFETKKPLLLPGGWAGNPSGHAMYYEVIPETNGTGTFRLYNLGAGSNNHDPIEVDNKTKATPFEDWKGISLEKLLDENFLTAIHELMTHTHLPGDTSNKTEYRSEDIYNALKEILSPAATTQTEKPVLSKKMTTQQAGICSWKSLMAFLHTRLSKTEAGKKEYTSA